MADQASFLYNMLFTAGDLLFMPWKAAGPCSGKVPQA
jgi:hypothetical protein